MKLGLFGALVVALCHGTAADFSKPRGFVAEVAKSQSDNHVANRNLQAATGPSPVETYFVPFPEQVLFDETFEAINTRASGNVNTLISIAVSAQGTIIWYDHHEDGYETDVTDPIQTSTQVWGDGDCTNGCLDAADILNSGQAIVLENAVKLPRWINDIVYDGGDRIKASFPIAVTRGAFPDTPGSLMAGAVEVLKTTAWGTNFEAPLGENTPSSTNAFEYTSIYVQADLPTEVKKNGVTQGSLNRGETLLLKDIQVGDKITSDEPVQVDLITGDVGSTYELRWFSLSPTTDWSNDYYSPVGSGNSNSDTKQTRVWLYNPNTQPIDVSYNTASSTGLTVSSIPPGTAKVSGAILRDSGARFYTVGGENFFAVAQIEATGSGLLYDWGFPLVPRDQLTSQALIGWGYGCTNNNCYQSTNIRSSSRSVVWVTPVSEANIYVDYENDDSVDVTLANVSPLEQRRITAPDEDMTGALIYAKDATGNPVDIAVAWGQDPHLSGSGDNGALDLGTTIPPLPTISSGKHAKLFEDADGDCQFSPGDTIEYSISVFNIGQVDIPSGAFFVEDSGPLHTTYVANSAYYTNQDGTTQIPDGVIPGGLPGVAQIGTLSRRGGIHVITFRVKIDDADVGSPLCNAGLITNSGTVYPQPGFSFATSTYVATEEVACEGNLCPEPVPAEQAVNPVGTSCQELWTGQQDEGIRDQVVGRVCTEVVDGVIQFEVTVTEPGCTIEETHICNLPYASPYGLYTSSFVITVPEEEAYEFTCQYDETSYIVAGHAQLSCGEDADGEEIFQRSYWETPLSCPQTAVAGTVEGGFRIPAEDPVNPLSECQTAWAYVYDNDSCYPHRLGNEEENCATCFLNVARRSGGTRMFQRWGWVLGAFDDHNQYWEANNIPHDAEYTAELWAGAEQCDRSRGTKVGTVTLDYHTVPGQVTVTYLLDGGLGMKETHLYVGAEKLPKRPNGRYTIEPKDFPFMHEGLNFATGDVYTESGFNGPIFMAAHAIVCPLSANV